MLFFWFFSQKVFQWKLPFIYLKSPPRAFRYQRAKMKFSKEKHLHRNCSIVPSVLLLFLNPLQINSSSVSLSQPPILSDCTTSNVWMTSSSPESPAWGKSAVTELIRQKELSCLHWEGSEGTQQRFTAVELVYVRKGLGLWEQKGTIFNYFFFKWL